MVWINFIFLDPLWQTPPIVECFCFLFWLCGLGEIESWRIFRDDADFFVLASKYCSHGCYQPRVYPVVHVSSGTKLFGSLLHGLLCNMSTQTTLTSRIGFCLIVFFGRLLPKHVAFSILHQWDFPSHASCSMFSFSEVISMCGTCILNFSLWFS